jgi:putative nucleotidyltransferase with HDIG domain
MTNANDPSALSTLLRSSRDSHNCRVAALAREIARCLPNQKKLPEIESVAWLHDCPREIFSDCLVTNKVVQGIQQAQGEKTGPGGSGSIIGEIVTLANAFDEMIEWLPVEQTTVTRMVAELAQMNEFGLWRPEVDAAFRKICKPQWDTALAAAERLPVNALSEVLKLALVPADDLSVETLSQTALKDPVLSADLLRVINSWAFPNLRKRVGSVREAICYLGCEATRTIMVGSASRKVFASKTLQGLWKHSMSVAAHAQNIGAKAGCDPELSFLCGLFHDIGRLAIEQLDADTVEIRSRLSEPGIPVIWVDLVTCRHDHAEIGGTLLWRWNFPREMVEAVTHHHAPEKSASVMASVLYLAELRSDEIEDDPSPIKLSYALRNSNLTVRQVKDSEPSPVHASLMAA